MKYIFKFIPNKVKDETISEIFPKLSKSFCYSNFLMLDFGIISYVEDLKQ